MIKNIAKKVLIIISIIAVIFTVISFDNYCLALGDVTNSDTWQNWTPTVEGSTELTKKVETILGVIRIIGFIISVATLAIIGIKTMLGSTEEKAHYKQALLPWTIGAVMVFAITTIPTIIYNFTTGASTLTGTSKDIYIGFDSGILDIYNELENNKEKYINQVPHGGTYITYQDMSSFSAYIMDKDDATTALITQSANGNSYYYTGVSYGIRAAREAVDAYNLTGFIDYMKGYKEAISEIENGTVTSESIEDIIESVEWEIENDDSSYSNTIMREGYKRKLENQKSIWEAE